MSVCVCVEEIPQKMDVINVFGNCDHEHHLKTLYMSMYVCVYTNIVD